MSKTQFGVGRGGNKASQQNLKTQHADYFVMLQGDLGLWSVLFGPMQKGRAFAVDSKMNRLGSRTSVGTRQNALHHDALGVAQNEARRALI